MSAAAQRVDSEPMLLESLDGGVRRLVLNRPAARNALSVGLMSALQQALGRTAAERECRVVVIAGAGPAFCAGHDLRELRADPSRAAYERVFAQCSDLMQQIVALPKPVIAEVHGIATAAGCQLVATCDLAVAAEDARFATPGVNIGLFCSTPMVALTRAVGRKAAMEMLLTGDLVDAQKALDWGLVNQVVPAAELEQATAALAAKIAEKPPVTVATGKRAFYDQMELGAARAYELASCAISASFAHDEGRQGMDAFLEKRKPPKH